MVGFNVRGADLRAVVEVAERRAAAAARGHEGVRLVWGGQYESFEAARRRLGLVIPAVLVAIVLVLLWTFRRAGFALLILLNVPFACVGGALLLWARGLPLSMPAAVGFISLGGGGSQRRRVVVAPPPAPRRGTPGRSAPPTPRASGCARFS